MPTALDAIGTTFSTAVATGTSGTDTNLTVGASATALIYYVIFNGDGGTTSGVSAHWDSAGTNQPMTLLATRANANGAGQSLFVFGLLNPTPGPKTFTANWTASTGTAVFFGESWTGTITSSFGACFNHTSTANSAVGSTNWSSGTVSTTSLDAVAGCADAATTGETFSNLTGVNDITFNAAGQGGSAFISHVVGSAGPTAALTGTASVGATFSGVVTNIAGTPVAQQKANSMSLVQM